MQLIFVHGWSVTDTDTYGQLPEALAKYAPAQLDLQIQHIYLGRYISFHNEVTVDDLARAFENARQETIGKNEFSCITHSTGGPVIRAWVDRFYGKDRLSALPLKHLVMLAPANHGSALAQLGKARISRIGTWFQGVEPGEGVLNWLELGSNGQRNLNLNWIGYKTAENGFYPFVLTGESIDKKLYDFINSYTAEKGSDGVVRVAAANMNYAHVQLKQNLNIRMSPLKIGGKQREVFGLETAAGKFTASPVCPLEVLSDTSHSGKKKGIMYSVTNRSPKTRPVIRAILECIQVNSKTGYDQLTQTMAKRTADIQSKDKYVMLVFRVSDDQGNEIKDYDLYLLAGKDYQPDKLPKGFFVDRQKNNINRCHLTYYLNGTLMRNIADNKIGFRIVARPDEGFSYYSPAEFHSGEIKATDLIKANETLMVDIELKRRVDAHTFRLDKLTDGRIDFKDEKPVNEE